MTLSSIWRFATRQVLTLTSTNDAHDVDVDGGAWFGSSVPPAQRDSIVFCRETTDMAITIGAPMTFTVRAARHPRKKATKGHTDTRPKKHRASDRNRTPVSYPEMKPEDKPAVFTVVSK
jgi:50S ribosomal protein 6